MATSSWSTPTLKTVRQTNRDYLVGALGVPLVPNSVARVLADANAGNAHLALQYLDWLANQLLPDTAETQFLDKWGNIFITNADGSTGRKAAGYASGSVTLTATSATVLPAGSELTGPTSGAVLYQTVAATTIGTLASPVAVRALTAGTAGNLDAGQYLSLNAGVAGINSRATVVTLTGGTDEETDDDLRARVLARIQKPPMGGDGDDWVAWALSVDGVTRAWCSPNEMGVGTVTVRFMCDDLRATSDPMTNGFPLAADIAAVTAYLDTVRPVTIKEFFVAAPVPQPLNATVTNLAADSASLRAAIATQVSAMLAQRAAPAHCSAGVAQPATTIPAAWVSEAIYVATDGVYFDLAMPDMAPVSNGSLAVLGTIS